MVRRPIRVRNHPRRVRVNPPVETAGVSLLFRPRGAGMEGLQKQQGLFCAGLLQLSGAWGQNQTNGKMRQLPKIGGLVVRD